MMSSRKRRRECTTSIYAQVTEAPTLLRKLAYVIGTVMYIIGTEKRNSVKLAVMKDVPAKQRGEEFVSDMVHLVTQNFASRKGVQTLLSEVEYVGVTEQRTVPKGATTKDVPIMLFEEEYVVGMAP